MTRLSGCGIGIVVADEELRVGQDVDRHAKQAGQPLLLEAAPAVLGRGHGEQPLRLPPGDVTAQPFPGGGGLHVLDSVAGAAQFLGVVTHGAEQQHQLLALVGQACEALRALDQHDADVGAVGERLRRSQGRMRGQQLIAQNPYRDARLTHGFSHLR